MTNQSGFESNIKLQEAERKIQGLSTLLQLQKEAMRCDDRKALAYLIVNESHRLLGYDQAILWVGNHIQAVSGMVASDKFSQIAQQISRLVRWLIKNAEPNVQIVKLDNISEPLFSLITGRLNKVCFL